MLRPEPRIRPEATITIRRRKLPEAVELTEQSEPEFRQFIRGIEDSRLYQALRDRGFLSKISLRGRIPRDKYDAYLDVEMVRLIHEHHISTVRGWFEELSKPSAVERPHIYAAKYKVDPGIIRRVARYCHRLQTSDRELEPGAASTLYDDSQASPIDRAAGSEVYESDEATETCSAFVARYNVDPRSFAADFLHEDQPANELATKYGAPVSTIAAVQRAIESMQIFEAFANTTETPDAEMEAPALHEEETVVASVERNAVTGLPVLTVDPDDVYAETYRLGAQGIEALYELAKDDKEAESLLFQIRLANQRKSLLYRFLTCLFKHQYEFFASSDPLVLRPLSQADLAREVSEDESTVSRLIRHKLLRFEGESKPLQWYCQKKRDVVARLIRVHPELSDRELADLLRGRYGCDITRRTVNYHRQNIAAPADGD